MRLGIDISQVGYAGSGVSRFTKGLVDAICSFDKKNEWVFFFSSFRQTLSEDIKKKILDRGFTLLTYRFPSSFLELLWNTLHIVNIEVFVGKLDWFITSDWTEPPSAGKKATIIHDLAYIRYPETVDWRIKKNQRKRLKWIKKESALIFSVSESTRKDAISFLDISEEKIKTIYEGVLVNSPPDQFVRATLKKHRVEKPFILSVGKIEPRKNLARLIEAFKQIPEENLELLVVGPFGWGESFGDSKHIRFLGYLPDDELYSLYKRCLFFVYPSVWEGFGLPVVEAMSLGAPVATSDVSSLKEIAEGAALLFNPFEASSIKNALVRLLKEEPLRKQLSQKGRERSKKFLWENYYRDFIANLKNNL